MRISRCALEDRSPEEVEVAASVFDRPHVSTEPRRGGSRLQPQAQAEVDDRRTLADNGEPTHALEAPAVLGERRLRPAEPRPSLGRLALAADAGGLVTLAALLLLERASLSADAKEVSAVRSGPVWGGLAADQRPTVIVVGDPGGLEPPQRVAPRLLRLRVQW